MNIKIQKNTIYDHLFWISLFLYTDPGGFMTYYMPGKIYYKLISFTIMTVLFTILPKKYFNNIKIYFIVIFIWLFYYVIVYGLINNSETSFMFFIKSRFITSLIAIILSVYVYSFICRNTKLFIRYLLLFSFTIFILLFLSLLTNIQFIPISTAQRNIFEGQRNMLYSYSLIPWCMPIALVSIFFKSRLRINNLILISGSMMLVVWILSLTRRHLLFSVLYFVIISYFATKLKYLKLIVLRKAIVMIVVSLLLIFLLFPSYLNFSKDMFNETFSVVSSGETTGGKQDQRLSLTGNKFITEIFRKNIAFGTGFDYRWSTSEGDKEGYEGSDYVFLASLAQHGIIGLLFFFPIYFYIYKNLFLKYSEIRKQKSYFFISEYDRLLFYFVMATFILDLINYVNYFAPAGWAFASDQFYIRVGILLGVLYRTTIKINQITERE